MIEISGSLYRLIYDSSNFFRYAQYYHIGMAIVLLGTGVTSTVLSYGSNGNAQVPYFFSAYIAGAWQILSAVVCQVSIYYLSGDGTRSSKASTWVRFYSILCSVFVLFNVMGVVFTVVNGMCIESQMCYYDKNHVANRTMAILLIFEHCLSTLISIILAKRSHLIESDLMADASVKLNAHFNFRIGMKSSSVSFQQSNASRSQQTTPENKRESGLSQIQNKGGHVLTTIEISAMTRTKTHRRSKSQPINLKQLSLKPDKIEGKIFSIYSDSESKQNEKSRKKKKRFVSPNRIKSLDSVPDRRIRSKSVGDDLDHSLSEEESTSSIGTKLSVEDRKQLLNQLEKDRGNTAPLSLHQNEDDDIFYVKPVGEIGITDDKDSVTLIKHENLQGKRENFKEEQTKLHEKYEKQRKLFQVKQK